MPNVQTRFFGELEYQNEALFRFPSGLPGFDDHRNFVFLKKPGLEPLMFLQSLHNRSLCFILLPMRAIDENFQIELTPDELHGEIDLAIQDGPLLSARIFSARRRFAREKGMFPTANLMAPVVVNLHNNMGIQTIHPETNYSHRHPLLPVDGDSPC